MPISVAKSFENYLDNYKKSIADTEVFWAEEGIDKDSLAKILIEYTS